MPGVAVFSWITAAARSPDVFPRQSEGFSQPPLPKPKAASSGVCGEGSFPLGCFGAEVVYML